MIATTKEDARVLMELLSDAAAEADYPVLFTASHFSQEMQSEIALLVLRAYRAGKEVGARR